MDTITEVLGIAKKRQDEKSARTPRLPAGIESGLIPILHNVRALMAIRKDLHGKPPTFFELAVVRLLEIGSETNPAMLEARLADMAAIITVWKAASAETRLVRKMDRDAEQTNRDIRKRL